MKHYQGLAQELFGGGETKIFYKKGLWGLGSSRILRCKFFFYGNFVFNCYFNNKVLYKYGMFKFKYIFLKYFFSFLSFLLLAHFFYLIKLLRAMTKKI